MDGGQTQEQMHRKVISLAHALTMRGSDVASFVEFPPPRGLGGDRMTDKWTNGWSTEAQMDGHTEK